MHRQPNRRLLRIGPLDSMSSMGRDVDEGASLHLDELILESQSCGTLQQHDEFALVLIVPKALGRCVAVGDDPLDAEGGLVEDRLDQFFGEARRNVGEEVGEGGHSCQIPSVSIFLRA